MTDSSHEKTEIVSDPDVLLRYGVCKVRISTDKVTSEEWHEWAEALSQITPEIMAGEGDGEFVFYRNILQLEEPNFPFDAIIQSSIGDAIIKHFGLKSMDELRLDDAFCIHYNSDQADTSGAKHTDPSDITVNLCLEKSDEVEGSHVLFYGTKSLISGVGVEENETDMHPKPHKFFVRQDPGYATIHWGDHLHETTPLMNGKRTNVILTFWYKDASRSDVASRSCYT